MDADFLHFDVRCLASPVGAWLISANMVLLKQFIVNSRVAKSLPGDQINIYAQRSQRSGCERKDIVSSLSPRPTPAQLSSALVVRKRVAGERQSSAGVFIYLFIYLFASLPARLFD